MLERKVTTAGCWYRTPDDHTNLQVTAVTGPQAAVRRPGGASIVAMKGNVLCMLYTDKDSRASLKGAEKYAGATIPDAAAVPLAQSLATLCTKLWN
jgi:hypothetical protein